MLGRASHSGVVGVLNRLSEQGVVDRAEAGRALLFTLNREHLAAPAVDVLAGMRAELLRRLQNAIEGWGIAPVHVCMFGSVARGEGDVHSDIDLFVVRPGRVPEEDERWREQLDELARRVQRWTGNRAGIAEVAETEIERLRDDAPPIIAELRADSITLAGPEVAALLGAR